MTAGAHSEQRNLWDESRERRPVAPALSSDISVDVAVIGAGYTGLAAAYHLKCAEPALEVAVLEAETCGFGASGRNAGFVMTLFGASLGQMVAQHGKARMHAAHEFMQGAIDALAATIAGHKLDCDFERSGFLKVATAPAYVARIRKEIATVESMGVEGFEWLDADAVRERVNSPTFLGGCYESGCGLINPVKWVDALRRIAVAKGARLFEGTRVETVQREGGSFRLTAARGTVRAQKVVFATNGYTHLIPGLRFKQIPAFAYIIATEPLSQEQRAALRWAGREGLEDARNFMHFFRLTPDNRLLAGGGPGVVPFAGNMHHDASPESVGASRQLHCHDVPGAARHPHHPPLGRRVLRHAQLHPADRHAARRRGGLFGRLHRPRRRHDAPERGHPCRPRARAQNRALRAVVRQPPLAAVPARAVALPRHQGGDGDDGTRRLVVREGSDMKKIAVIGATGMLGLPVARALSEAGFAVTALARNPDAARRVLPEPIAIIAADARDEDSLRRGLAGADGLYLNLSVAAGERQGDFHTEAQGLAHILAAAAATGITRVGYLSALIADSPERWWVLDVWRAAIARVKASGIPSTIFYPSNFMETLAQRHVMGGALVTIGSALYPNYWIAGADYGRQVARAFALPEAANREYVIQGPEPLTYAEAAARYAAAKILARRQCAAVDLRRGGARLAGDGLQRPHHAHGALLPGGVQGASRVGRARPPHHHARGLRQGRVRLHHLAAHVGERSRAERAGEGQPLSAAPVSAPHPNPLPVRTGRGGSCARRCRPSTRHPGRRSGSGGDPGSSMKSSQTPLFFASSSSGESLLDPGSAVAALPRPGRRIGAGPPRCSAACARG